MVISVGLTISVTFDGMPEISSRHSTLFSQLHYVRFMCIFIGYFIVSFIVIILNLWLNKARIKEFYFRSLVNLTILKFGYIHFADP